VPPRIPDRALAGIDRDAGCRSARTTGLVPALEEAFALGGTERKPLGLVSRPTQTQPLSSGENPRSGRAACALSEKLHK
jgi:hypothetical protein